MSVTELVIIRHGESAGNAAAAAANAAGAEVITVDRRDADVPLSADGVEQAQALQSAVTPLLTDGARVGSGHRRTCGHERRRGPTSPDVGGEPGQDRRPYGRIAMSGPRLSELLRAASSSPQQPSIRSGARRGSFPHR